MPSNPDVDLLIDRIDQDLIGGAADMAAETALAFAAAIAASRAATIDELRNECLRYFDRIIAATPSVMPVTFILHRIGLELERSDDAENLVTFRERLESAATDGEVWIREAVGRIAAYGADMIRDGETMFTYSISSTVYAIIRAAIERGKSLSVVTTESRPGNEALRTIDEMAGLGVHVTIGIDAALGQLIRSCRSVYVGGDTITAKGEALCKVGSLLVALAARRYDIPFRVAADVSKFDRNTLQGIPLRIREMPESDIVEGEIPAHVTVRNPVFEVIPADLIDALVTDAGVINPAATLSLMGTIPYSPTVATKVASYYRNGQFTPQPASH